MVKVYCDKCCGAVEIENIDDAIKHRKNGKCEEIVIMMKTMGTDYFTVDSILKEKDRTRKKFARQ